MSLLRFLVGNVGTDTFAGALAICVCLDMVESCLLFNGIERVQIVSIAVVPPQIISGYRWNGRL